MKLRYQIILLTILPLCLLAALSVFTGLEFRQYIYDDFRERTEEKAEGVKRHILNDLRHLKSSAEKGANLEPLVDALVNNDRMRLFRIVANQVEATDDQITVLDANRRILVRSTDINEYGKLSKFRGELGEFTIRKDDGNYFASYLMPIHQDDTRIGYLQLCKPLNYKYLRNIAGYENVELDLFLGSTLLASQVEQRQDDWNRATVNIPIVDAPQGELLFANVYVDNTPLQSKFQAKSLQMLTIVSMVIILTLLIVGLVISRQVLNPLTRLSRYIRELRQVDRPQGYRFPDNEVGEIATTVNDLQDSLDSRSRELNAALKRLEGEARKLETENYLLMMLCHDISNPLSVIFGATYQGRKSSPDSDLWSKVRESSLNIKELISSVRDIKAIGMGKKQVIRLPLDIESLIAQAISKFDRRITRKDLTIETDFRHQAFRFQADPHLFEASVLSNLFTNAIKFSPKQGRIRISTYVVQEDFCIEISDEGEGIADNLKGHLFDVHYNTSRPGTWGELGTGFGMPICKKVIELFDGTLELLDNQDSRAGFEHGATFKMVLKVSRGLAAIEAELEDPLPSL